MQFRFLKHQRSASEQEIREANIIIGNPNAAMIGASENLELLQLESAGADQ
ncbi:MAG: hypothetical protein V8S87_08155 [Oscillospiraceae bacterium]